jgi:hypothetical protein
VRTGLNQTAVRFIANVLIFAVAIVLPASADATTIEQFGAGGDGVPASISPGACTGAGAPACQDGDTCECLTFSGPIQFATQKSQKLRADRDDNLDETMSIDLTDATPNGAGGFCYPWNGTGLLTEAKNGATISLPGQGRICEIGTSTSSLSAEGTFNFENGTGRLAGASGEGNLDVAIGTIAGSDIAHPEGVAPAFPPAIALIFIAGMIFGAVCGGGGCF